MTFLQRGGGTPVVVTDPGSGRPTAVRIGSVAHVVSDIDAVRDETFAYPVQTGPRTVFRVRADGRRFQLVHRHQTRDWSVQSIDRADTAVIAA